MAKTSTEETVIDAKPEKPKGKPRKRTESGKIDPIPKIMTFFQRVRQIPKEDWGARAKIKMYRLEPIIDHLRTGSNVKYIAVYIEPIDEERIKLDQGSGRYRLHLNYKAPAADEKELDSTEFDILDENFPPKISKGEWIDNPINQKWQWAKKLYDKQNPPEPTPQQQQQGGLAETLNAYTNVRKQAFDELKALQPEKASPIDELNTLTEVAARLRPPETVPQFLATQFATLQSQIQAANERADKYLMQIIDKGQQKTDGLGTVKELLEGLSGLLPKVKEVFPGAGEMVGAAVARSRMGGWQEFTVAVAPYVSDVLKPFSALFAHVLAQNMVRQKEGGGVVVPTAQPGMNGSAPAGQIGSGPTTEPSMMPFLQMIAAPMMNYVRPMGPPHNVPPAEIAADFASWVQEGFGADPRYEEALTAARLMGPTGVIAAFRSTPLWSDRGPRGNLPSLSELEPQFQDFIRTFLDWRPAAEEQAEPVNGAPQVVHFDDEFKQGAY